MSGSRYTCACCGYKTLKESPGSYEICAICYWEDDPVQLLDPWFRGGANAASLDEAQRSYATVGVSEPRFKSNVRAALASDIRDPGWRPVNEDDRKSVRTPAQLDREQPDGGWQWYYWQT
jgi:hypothetical protein